LAGLVTNVQAPCGFPHVGKNFVCFGRDFDTATTSSGVATLATTGSYTFAAGDVVAVRLGWSALASVATAYNAFEAKIGSTSLGYYRWETTSPALGNVVAAWKVYAAINGALSFLWNTSTTTANVNLAADWVSIDHVAVYPAVPAAAYDNEF
jgi:hypothetical protein